MRGRFQHGEVTPTAPSNEVSEEENRASKEDARGRTSVCVQDSNPKGDLQ